MCAILSFMLLPLLFGAVLEVQAQDEPVCTSHGLPGQWSNRATQLCAAGNAVPILSRDLKIYSPNHQMLVHVVKEHWWVEVGNRRVSLPAKENQIEYPAEMGWSPDSRAFYITWSDGSIEGFTTQIYRIEMDQVTPLSNVTRMIQRDFNRRHKCVSYFHGENIGPNPNVAGLTWIDGSKQLVLVAEVPPEGICEQLDYFGGYLVSLPEGRIIGRYSPAELERGWGSVLGDRLRADYENLTPRQKAMKP